MDEKIDDLTHHNEMAQEVSGKEVTADRKYSVLNPRLAAVIQENKPDPWGRGYRHLYFCCALVFLCSTMNGQLQDTPPNSHVELLT